MICLTNFVKDNGSTINVLLFGRHRGNRRMHCCVALPHREHGTLCAPPIPPPPHLQSVLMLVSAPIISTDFFFVCCFSFIDSLVGSFHCCTVTCDPTVLHSFTLGNYREEPRPTCFLAFLTVVIQISIRFDEDDGFIHSSMSCRGERESLGPPLTLMFLLAWFTTTHTLLPCLLSITLFLSCLSVSKSQKKQHVLPQEENEFEGNGFLWHTARSRGGAV